MVTTIRQLLCESGLHDIAGQQEGQIVRHLRQRQLVVACTETVCSLEPEHPN
jgi:hypothetical protein